MQKVSYLGNGETTEFTFNFPYFENTDIIVTKNGTTASGYNIVGNSAGLDADIPYTSGKVVFEIAPTVLDTITIARNLPLTRQYDYQPLVKINPTTLNQDMNYMMEVIKDLQDELDDLRTQYSEIADKESATTLLARISAIHDEIVAVSAQITALGDVSQIRTDIANKLNKTLDNIPDDAKITSVSWGRQFTNVDTTIATGNASIAGTYTLGFADTKTKLGLFESHLETVQSGSSTLAMSTDVINTCRVAGCNAGHKSETTIMVPFINSITISFPVVNGGVGNGTYVKFIGWM